MPQYERPERTLFHAGEFNFNNLKQSCENKDFFCKLNNLKICVGIYGFKGTK